MSRALIGRPARRAGDSPLFLVPLRLEAVAVRLGAPRAECRLIGMGPVRAVAACAQLSRVDDGRPTVLTGCAGGLDPSLRPGDLVVASSLSELSEPGSVELPAAGQVAEILRSSPSIAGSAVTVHLGPVVSSPRIVHGNASRDRSRLGGCLAVDMESLWCAPLARSRPFAVVRVVLDVPGADLLSPSTFPALARCARSLSAAARALGGWVPDSVTHDNLLEVGDN